MSQHSPIQWCDSTVNPVMGCDGCELWQEGRKTCFAGVQHQFRGGNPGWAKRFEVVEQFPGRMAAAARWSDLAGTKRPDKPWLDGLPRIIFISDMGDALSKSVPFEFLHDEIIRNVTSPAGQRHIWMWLTKQASRLFELFQWLKARGIAWPANLWAGTSVTTQATARARIRWLLRMGDGSTVRFVSVEPQVEHIDLRPWLPPNDFFLGRCSNCGLVTRSDRFELAPTGAGDASLICPHCREPVAVERVGGLHLIIQGAESGKDARRFELAWVRSMRRDCKAAGVGLFLKQLGACASDPVNGIAGAHLRVPDEAQALIFRRLRDSHGGDWSEWPEDLRVRQMPEVKRAA